MKPYKEKLPLVTKISWYNLENPNQLTYKISSIFNLISKF